MKYDALLAALRAEAARTDRLWVNPTDGSEMIRIPAGEFRCGPDDAPLSLPAFSLARHPVTNAAFARFLAATGYQPPADHPDHGAFLARWEGGAPPAGEDLHPVVFVSWHDAQAYCRWAGLTLPTEPMWEKAARGPDGRPYPWGSAYPSPQIAAVMGSATVPVGSFPRTRTAYGCQDMIGNVSEWCQPADGDPEADAPAPVRGSAYMRVNAHSGRMTCAHARLLSAARRNHWVGFRPAKLGE